MTQTYLLTWDGTRYAGTSSSTYMDSCSSKSGALTTANGYTVTSRIIVSPTRIDASTGGVLDFAVTHELHSVATPEALDMGCLPVGDTVIELEGSFTPPPAPVTKTIVTPTLRAVGYIDSFDIGKCTKNIKATPKLPASAQTVCPLIYITKNKVPSSQVASSDTAWANFIASGEYRMIAALPSYQVKCTDGKVDQLPAASNGEAFRSFGYTPIRLRGGKYLPGDPFTKSPWSTDRPTLTVLPGGSTLAIDYKVAARAPLGESWGNLVFSTDILPFVWVSVHEQVSCDGGIDFRVDSSNTPTKMMFVDGRLVAKLDQTADWGAFLSNGIEFAAPSKFASGRGIMDPNCSRSTFSGYRDSPVKTIGMSYASCQAITG